MSVLELTDKDFDKTIKSNPVVVVDFWAPWCGPCRAMAPIYDEVAEELKDKSVLFTKINLDENSQAPSQYGVMSIPTLIIFKNGKPAEQMIGVQDKKGLKDKISTLI